MMMASNKNRFGWIKVGITSGVLVMGLNAWLPFYNWKQVEAVHREQRNVETLIKRLNGMVEAVVTAQSSVRGYIITGQQDYLEPYFEALVTLRPEMRQAAHSLADDPSQAKLFAETERLIAGRVEDMSSQVEARRTGGFEAASRMLVQLNVNRKTADIRRNIDALIDTEQRQLNQITTRLASREEGIIWTMLVATGINIGVFGLIFYVMLRTLLERNQAQSTVEEANRALREGTLELAARNREMGTFKQMTDILQSCITLKESYGLVSRFMQHLLPGYSGRIYLNHHSNNLLESVADFGEPVASQDLFEPQACWGLRRSHVHCGNAMDTDVICEHIDRTRAGDLSTACLPMLAHGETLGLIVLERRRDAMDAGNIEDAPAFKTARMLCEQAALALSNMRLRESLRAQSTSDALTSLNNRRFLAENLPREVIRAKRKSLPIAVMMLDVDHFKRFNDAYGHEAGDLVLRAVADTFRVYSRGSDLACRYGGEEFALVFPEMIAEKALQRADEIREAVSHIKLIYGGQSLGRVTISIGLAMFPDQGEDHETLLRAADAALYHAKESGRNRVAWNQKAAEVPSARAGDQEPRE